MVLELLAPICKREKSGIHSHRFFPLEASFPTLDACVDRLSTEAFLPWSDLACPLPTQMSYSSICVLSPRQGGDAPGVDLMAPRLIFSSLPPSPLFDLLEWFPRIFLKLRLWGGASVLHVPCTFLSTILAAVETVSHKGTNINQDVPFECHHAGICDSKRDSGGLASKEKVIFVLRLLGPILPVHSHRFHKRNI